jgi:alkylation response protein AidB-like acyl-CoA dehydrogenase
MELALIAEELGAALAPVPLLSNASAGLMIAAAGSAEQQDRLLPGIADGSTRGALALAADDGTAAWVADAAGAALVVIVEGDRAWLADADAEITPLASIDGLRRYAAVRAPGGEELPGPVHAALDRAEILIAAELVGVAQRAVDLAVAYAKEREQFGRPIGTFQGVSHRCADMFLATEKLRSLVLFAAWAADHDAGALPLAASVAKAAAGQIAVGVVQDCIQVHGGIGFTWEHDAHLLLKRAQAARQQLDGAATHLRRIGALRRGAPASFGAEA